MDKVQSLGAWTVFATTISSEANKVFVEVTKGLFGVSYKPFSVAMQVVNGTNYRFLCNSKVIYPGATNQLAQIDIYHPVNGEAHITSIKRID